MILSFKCNETKNIFKGYISTKFPIQIQNVARRKLRMLNNSVSLLDLRIPPSNRLERLRGDRSGQYSIRVNQKYRICFEFHAKNIYQVEIIDYH